MKTMMIAAAALVGLTAGASADPLKLSAAEMDRVSAGAFSPLPISVTYTNDLDYNAPGTPIFTVTATGLGTGPVKISVDVQATRPGH